MAEYYFNLPPITQLTIDQQAALNETNAIALSGGPGTGKSVVSLWRHISNHQRNKQSQLLTYTTTLAMYLRMCSKSQNKKASENVDSSYSWLNKASKRDEIIVDEAQDLPSSYYERLIKYSSVISYGADDAQILYPDNSTTQSQLKTIFPSNRNYQLSRNFRSTQRIMQFAKAAFIDAYIPSSTIANLSNNVGELPIMLISGGNKLDMSNDKQDAAIINIIRTFTGETHNIAILLPWKNQVREFYNKINGTYPCSRYYEDRNDFPNGCGPISNIHITTFKSSKGLEFDTVIIPNFDKMFDNIPAHLPLKWQDFYVAVTRARSNLYLIVNRDISQLNDSVIDKSKL